MVDIIRALIVLVVAVISVRAGFLAVGLFRGDGNAYDQNRARTGGLRRAAFGRVATEFDGRRDYRVAAGIAVNRTDNAWLEQGRLSNEAIQSTLKQ